MQGTCKGNLLLGNRATRETIVNPYSTFLDLFLGRVCTHPIPSKVLISDTTPNQGFPHEEKGGTIEGIGCRYYTTASPQKALRVTKQATLHSVFHFWNPQPSLSSFWDPYLYLPIFEIPYFGTPNIETMPPKQNRSRKGPTSLRLCF